MNDDDNIRLAVICSAIGRGEDPHRAWDISQAILDRWHATAPYAPPFQCVHGRSREQDCPECDAGTVFRPSADGPARVTIVGTNNATE